LSPPADAFIGRGPELATVEGVFQSRSRLVSIVGPSGIGKTRLALEYAAGQQLKGEFRAICAVPLDGARDLDEVMLAIARELALPLAGAGSSAAQIATALSGRPRLLLILDDLPASLPGLSRALESWLTTAPELCILVTARIPLMFAAERRVELAPLTNSE